MKKQTKKQAANLIRIMIKFKKKKTQADRQHAHTKFETF